MKQYAFIMKDKLDGTISKGQVDGETWQKAWNKLTPLRSGHIILSIDDIDAKDTEASNMSILETIEQEDEQDEEPKSEKLFRLDFMLMAGQQLSVVVGEELADHISEWFHYADDEDVPSTFSIQVVDTLVSLDRMFIGAIFKKEYIGDVNKPEEVEGAIIDGIT